MYLKRQIESTIINISKSFPVLLLTGPRQVGKTTLLKHLAGKERTFVTLDAPDVRMLAKTDPRLFFQTYKPPILIDEIQYAPELLPFIKIMVDESHNKGDFWLTGSQVFRSMKNVSESLAGRIAIITLNSFSYAEINGYNSDCFENDIEILKTRQDQRENSDIKELFKQIQVGGMPTLNTSKVDWEIYFNSYLQTYIERDIRDLTQVGDEMAFYKFMVSAAARTAQIVNLSELSRDSGISIPTAKQWLSVLVSSGIVYLLKPYYNNSLKRLTKTEKLYFMDTGLCAYLTKWKNSEVLESGAASGAFFETWVVTEIIKSFINQGKEPPLYYYRDKDMVEIDLMIWRDNKIFPIEIKKSANPGKESVKNFNTLKRTNLEIGSGIVICMYPEVFPIDEKNYRVPAWLI